MDVETALLSDLISAAPSGAAWMISSDSWDEIPSLLGVQSKASDTEWEVKLSQEKIKNIITNIEDNDLGDKIVHMRIISKAGIEIFKSYDRMSIVIIKNLYDLYKKLYLKYPELEIYFE